MHASTVILVSLFTSALATAGSVYVIERYGILPPRGPVPETVVVPDLHGMSETDARSNANGAHVSLFVASHEPSADAKPATVLRQSLAAGQRVPREQSVSVVIADEVVKVPAVTGLAAADATQRIEQKGYVAQIGGTVPDATIPSGNVVSQSPKADSVQPKGGTVTIQVSSGPGDVEIPKLVGSGIAKAQKDLEQIGLKSVVKWVAMAETPTYVVLAQKPAAREKVKPGTEVALTVCR
jgi:eukaryotic-like serine/threonine-protein kinase